MLFTGTYSRAIDEKLRIAIPRPVRETFGEAMPNWLYMAPGTDGSLAIYTQEGLERLAERLSSASPARGDVRAFSRLFYGQAHRLEVDRQGRIRIPQELATGSGFSAGGSSQEVVLVGVNDHLELWARGRWEAYIGACQQQYDQIAEAAFDEAVSSAKGPRA